MTLVSVCDFFGLSLPKLRMDLLKVNVRDKREV